MTDQVLDIFNFTIDDETCSPRCIRWSNGGYRTVGAFEEHLWDKCRAQQERIDELERRLAEAEKDAVRWNWLVNDCDGNAQDDFIQWLARNVATKEQINEKANAAIAAQSKAGKGGE